MKRKKENLPFLYGKLIPPIIKPSLMQPSINNIQVKSNADQEQTGRKIQSACQSRSIHFIQQTGQQM